MNRTPVPEHLLFLGDLEVPTGRDEIGTGVGGREKRKEEEAAFKEFRGGQQQKEPFDRYVSLPVISSTMIMTRLWDWSPPRNVPQVNKDEEEEEEDERSLRT